MLKPIGLQLYKAIFVSDGENRFICRILLNNAVLECYVPLTCKLSRFILPENREILIMPTSTTAQRTKYSLFAVKTDEHYLIVNTAFANLIVKRLISEAGKDQEFFPEQFVGNYKCDFFSRSTNTLIEVKSVISLEKALMLPNMKSIRAISQLKSIRDLLSKNYNVVYIIVAFSNNLESIVFDYNTDMGMLLRKVETMGGQIECLKVKMLDTNTICINMIPYSFE